VEPVVEAGDDAEVATASPDRPEEVCVAVAVDLQDLAVGGHHLRAEQVVDRQPVLAHEVADATAEREAADPDRGRVAKAHGEPVAGGGRRHLTRGEAAGGMHDPRVGVDLERSQSAEVEHEAALARAVAGSAVAAAANRELDAGLSRERDDARDLAGICGSDDRRRAAVDRREEDGARRLVAGLVRPDHGIGQAAELTD
jgi:hypothetical protein